ncbi:MAG: guanylate kinase [Candidatus Omnitrophica bacterium]|nr:guanylate kinase [Candidatus Omnitrophota bacterium]
MNEKGNLFIVSAPSGTGKTTVVRALLKKMRGVTRSISVTTRPPRKGEKKKNDYCFISETSFKNKVRKGEFLEWAKNFGHYYGTPKKTVYATLKMSKDVILTIDVKGAAQVKRKKPDSVTIFIVPPSPRALVRRLKKRSTDGSKEIKERLKIAKKEMSFARKYDYLIVNDKIKEAVEKLKAVITAKRCKVDKNRNR